jgi:hypothetical protein
MRTAYGNPGCLPLSNPTKRRKLRLGTSVTYARWGRNRSGDFLRRVVKKSPMGFWPRSFQSSLHEPLLHINQGSRVLHLFVAGDLPLCDGLVSLYCKEVAKFRGHNPGPSSFKVNDQDRYYLYPSRQLRHSFPRARVILLNTRLNQSLCCCESYIS